MERFVPQGLVTMSVPTPVRFLALCLSLGACGGVSTSGEPDASRLDGSTDAGPPATNPPRVVDAAVPDDSGACPSGQIVVIPCCGGMNNGSCSHGGPPAPPKYCAPLPSNCAANGACNIPGTGCGGVLHPDGGSLQCMCT